MLVNYKIKWLTFIIPILFFGIVEKTKAQVPFSIENFRIELCDSEKPSSEDEIDECDPHLFVQQQGDINGDDVPETLITRYSYSREDNHVHISDFYIYSSSLENIIYHQSGLWEKAYRLEKKDKGYPRLLLSRSVSITAKEFNEVKLLYWDGHSYREKLSELVCDPEEITPEQKKVCGLSGRVLPFSNRENKIGKDEVFQFVLKKINQRMLPYDFDISQPIPGVSSPVKIKKRFVVSHVSDFLPSSMIKGDDAYIGCQVWIEFPSLKAQVRLNNHTQIKSHDCAHNPVFNPSKTMFVIEDVDSRAHLWVMEMKKIYEWAHEKIHDPRKKIRSNKEGYFELELSQDDRMKNARFFYAPASMQDGLSYQKSIEVWKDQAIKDGTIEENGWYWTGATMSQIAAMPKWLNDSKFVSFYICCGANFSYEFDVEKDVFHELKYSLQVGVFKNLKNAEGLVEKLNQVDGIPWVKQSPLYNEVNGSEDQKIQVNIEAFRTQEEARQLGESLQKSQHISSYLVKKYEP